VRRAKWFRVFIPAVSPSQRTLYSNSVAERLQVPLLFSRSLDLRSLSAGKHP
jgi:hypothetical protein